MARSKIYILGNQRDAVVAALNHDLRRLSRGKVYQVTLEALREPISDAQRKLWWVWMDILANEVGYLQKEGFYEDSFKDSEILQGRGITDLSKDEMTDLMTMTQHAMADFGYYLPSSHDEYYDGLEAELAARGRRCR